GWVLRRIRFEALALVVAHRHDDTTPRLFGFLQWRTGWKAAEPRRDLEAGALDELGHLLAPVDQARQEADGVGRELGPVGVPLDQLEDGDADSRSRAGRGRGLLVEPESLIRTDDSFDHTDD